MIKAIEPKASLPDRVVIASEWKEAYDPRLSPAQQEYLEKHLPKRKRLHFRFYPGGLMVVQLPPSGDGLAQRKEALRMAGAQVQKQVEAEGIDNLQIECPLEPELSLALAEGLLLGAYRFKRYKKTSEEPGPEPTCWVSPALEEPVQLLNAAIQGTLLARDLVNEPLNKLSAKLLAESAQKTGEACGFSTEILDKRKLESLQMGGILAVNRGSQDPPTFSILKYHPAKAVNQQPIVLVGKGVVYDTGGLSLKPTPNSMDQMKSDMAGAAAVIGVFKALALAGIPLQVIGLIPASDNRPGENAYVPGDIISMYDKTTVEVLNTDAEGRLLLADALSYAKKFQPGLTIDVATLTGAAAVAIGPQGLVCMGTAEDEHFERLSAAGEAVYERPVRFPLWQEYRKLLDSPVADLKNIGGREAGAITAGKFLEHFTDYPWIHLDIAGPAFRGNRDAYRSQGGTGVGVRLIFDFLCRML